MVCGNVPRSQRKTWGRSVAIAIARRPAANDDGAVDGLYFVIGEEEKKIRRDPVGTGSAILKKVFGVFK